MSDLALGINIISAHIMSPARSGRFGLPVPRFPEKFQHIAPVQLDSSRHAPFQMPPTISFRPLTMRTVAWIILFLHSACPSGAVDSNPAEGFTTSARSIFYDVQSDSIPTLIAEMKEKGPLDDGARFFGKTDWSINWKYRYEQKQGRAVITSLSVTVDITYTLPRRVPPENRPDTLTAQWAHFMGALAVHERGHAENAIQHAKKLYATVRAPRVFATVAELEEFIRTEGEKFIAWAKTVDADYDKKTEHGATQGATLR